VFVSFCFALKAELEVGYSSLSFVKLSWGLNHGQICN